FNVVINTVFLFFAFVSTAFYPAEGTPEPLSTAFYFNPLTYLVDVVRAGIFGNFNAFLGMEMLVLVIMSLILFIIATKLLAKLEL
ncbi:MAG: ABC transporter permease, partial [Nitrosopumilaceae archaeon]